VASRTDLPPAVAALAETGLALLRRAPSARVAIARLGGVVDPDTLTPAGRAAFEEEVAAARAATTDPISGRDVERALREAWDRPPGKVLDELDLDEPLAVTPAAQVHRGEVDGDPVAIKVRRPGLERSVRNDLALLDVLGTPLRAAFPRLDAGAILRDAREQALDELDFEHEASNARRAARVVRDVDGVVAAKPRLDLCTPEVLVTDLLEGETMEQGARPPDPVAAAHALVAVHRAAALDAGLALVDPRPSHVVVAADGTLGLLGLGVARAVDRDRARLALDAFAALADDDADGFGSAVGSSGVLSADVAREALPVLRAIAGDLVTGPAVLDAAALRDAGERTARATAALIGLASAAAPEPQDLTLGRMLGQLVALLARLEAREDWPALLR
jgi:hypothetical protein